MSDVCGECFDDPALRRIVAENASEDECSFCGASGTGVAAPLDAVVEHIESCIADWYDEAVNVLFYDNEDARGFAGQTWTTDELVRDELELSFPRDRDGKLFSAIVEGLGDGSRAPEGDRDLHVAREPSGEVGRADHRARVAPARAEVQLRVERSARVVVDADIDPVSARHSERVTGRPAAIKGGGDEHADPHLSLLQLLELMRDEANTALMCERHAEKRVVGVPKRRPHRVQQAEVGRGDGLDLHAYPVARPNTFSLCHRSSAGSGRSAWLAGARTFFPCMS